MSLLVCIAPLGAELTQEHHGASSQGFTAKLVDKMLNRVVEASRLHHTAVDETTFMRRMPYDELLARRPDLVGLPWAGPSDGGVLP